MFRLPPTYRLPLLMALGMHFVLLICLMISLPQTKTLLPNAKQTPKIMQAKAVNQAQVSRAIAKIKSAEYQKRLNEDKRIRQLQRAAATARHTRFIEEQRLKRIAARKRLLARQANKEKRKVLAEKRRLATLKRLRAEAKKKAHERQQAIMKAKALQKKIEQQQLAQEASHVKQQLQDEKLQRLLSRYVSEVKAAVQDHWNKPKDFAGHQAVILSLNLAPGGVVLQAKVAKSSGNPVFDRSAVVAVYKASPLPVPKDPTLFDKFRQIDFTFNP